MFILGTSTVVAYVLQSSIDFIAPIPQTMRAALGQTGIGNLKLTSIAGGISTLFCLLISAYPFVNVVDAHAYAIKIVGTVMVGNCVAIGFYWMGTRFLSRRHIADEQTSSAD